MVQYKLPLEQRFADVTCTRRTTLAQPPASPYIVLPKQLTAKHQQLIVRYLQSPRAISHGEWVQALEAFNLLHMGRVVQGRSARTFQQFYQKNIDAVHATPFLEELLTLENIDQEGLSTVARYWQQIASDLNTQDFAENEEGVLLLHTYCLYWWQSFGKGYIREAAVFRDLQTSDILFTAHDLLNPAQRRSIHDLTLLGQRGDIKTSTYFLHNARFFPLRSDFYILRLFDTARNTWLDVVLLKLAAWHKLNGEPTPCTWESVANVLPTAAQLELRGETLVVVPYATWKMRVLEKQHSTGDEIA
jgi:hypothetical protein